MWEPSIDSIPSCFLLMNLALTNDFRECLMLHCAISFKQYPYNQILRAFFVVT